MFEEKNRYFVFLLPMLVLFTAVTIFPLFYELWLSFRSYNIARPWYPSGWVGLNNFYEILTDPIFWNSLKTTLVFVIGAVTVEFFFGMLIAVIFAREDQGRGKFIARTLIVSSMVLPPLSVGMIWRYLLNDAFGAVAIWLRNIGINFGWYGDPKTALATIIFIDVWQWTPFVFIILLAGIVSLPRESFEAAMIDGASRWKMFTKITIPLLKPVIIVAVLLRMLEAFKIFDTIWMLTKGGPVHSTEVIGVLVYLQAFISFNMGYAAALALILLVFSIGIAIAFIKISRFEI